MADGKKITDIVPPGKAQELNQSPVIGKHSTAATFSGKDENNPTETVSTNLETQGNAQSVESVNSSRIGVSINPVTENLKDTSSVEVADTSEPTKEEVSDFVSKPQEDNQRLISEEENQVTSMQENEIPKERAPYEASDSLPDENTKKTAEATDNMQSPKVYDTREYFVPIKKTAHKHGAFGIVLAGIITALLVATAIIAASLYFF